ncbi:MAG TPA: hypothetical protein VHM26_06235 [Chitinophagaceae bacterium]|nr:hypothetical protein [Chitinophagaceae bacterium]
MRRKILTLATIIKRPSRNCCMKKKELISHAFPTRQLPADSIPSSLYSSRFMCDTNDSSQLLLSFPSLVNRFVFIHKN